MDSMPTENNFSEKTNAIIFNNKIYYLNSKTKKVTELESKNLIQFDKINVTEWLNLNKNTFISKGLQPLSKLFTQLRKERNPEKFNKLYTETMKKINDSKAREIFFNTKDYYYRPSS